MSKAFSLSLACAAALLLAAFAGAEPAVLGLARTYLGPQSTLDGIASIHFTGTLDRAEPDKGPAGAVHTDLDMVFAKPLRQHLVMRATNVTLTTVLDGYDAWDWFQDNKDPSRYRLQWLQASDIRTLRANTWENLYYYQSPEGGSVEDMGPSTMDGVECERVDFTHGPGNVYERYFDRDTGRLVLTVHGSETFRESGELRASGVRFPKVIVSRTKTAAGGEIVSTATFASVAINEPLPAGLFDVPSVAKPRAVPSPTPTPGK
jgi:hypothetical protein